MTRANLLLWAAGTALHLTVLLLLLLRRQAGRFPIFTVLIAFYCLRSIVFYGMAARLRTASAAPWLSSLEILAILLETAVAFEIFSASLRRAGLEPQTETEPGTGPGVLARSAGFAVFVLLSVLGAAGLSAFVPPAPRLPLDRGIVFTAVLFVCVCIVAFVRRTPVVVRGLSLGFAISGVTSAASQVGRVVAFVHRDALGFQRWSYVAPVGYLLVLLLWAAVLWRSERVRRVIAPAI